MTLMTYKHIHIIRYTFIFLLLIVGVSRIKAQRSLPSSYNDTALLSYVRTWDVVKPTSSVSDLTIAIPTTKGKIGTQYIDGLGRPLQTVVKQGSLATGGAAVDMIDMTLYDEFGREVHKYLPAPANNTGSNTHISDGLFKLNPFAQQQSFYNTYLAGETGETPGSTTNWAYSQTNLEASPLNRPLETYAPGVSWVGSENTTKKSIKANYWINKIIDSVRIWTVTDGSTGSFGTYATTATYPAGELYKNATEDEHGNQVIEFTDKSGLVILKKVQLKALKDDGTGKNHDDWLCTYYIYDDLNRLRAVIQPEGVKLLSGTGWAFTPTLLNEQTFRYEYDHRSRMTMKKVPGAGEVYMVYDTRDRLIMTQDANMRSGTVKWLVIKYDGLNRPLETGLLTNNTAFTSHITAAAAATPGTYPATTSGYEILAQTGYDNYTNIPSGLSATYLTTWNSLLLAASNTDYPYPQTPQQTNATKGMTTWSKIKVLGTANQYLGTVIIYDDKGRAIQTQSHNISGGIDVITTQYSWAGLPLITIRKQEKTGSPSETAVAVTKMSYDDLGRLTATDKKLQHTLVNSNTMSDYKTIATAEYDALGQLKKKTLAPDYGDDGLETLTHDYNIRGWLLGVNRDYAREDNDSRYFGFDLGYDKQNNQLIGSQTYTKAQYNGNISGMVWKSKGSGVVRKYDFDYDAANRLLKGDFTQYTGSSFNKTAGINYDIKMGDGTLENVNDAYDYNGNIKRMQQWGLKLNASEKIDDLGYTYIAGSNKLLKVMDGVTTDNKLGDFKDGSNGTGDDYAYDNNGNLITDNNKAISSITYNHLNLPHTITVTGKGTITYTYDAAGNKLQKTTTETGATVDGFTTNITTTTTYIGGSVYESKTYSHTSLSAKNQADKLLFMGMEEGRIRIRETDNTFQYDYMLKDHLGNVRMVLTDEEKINYYPATTLEGTFSSTGTSQAASMVNYEKQFYNIDDTKIKPESSIASWGTESIGNTKLYYNNNGNPPANLSYPSGTTPVQEDGSNNLYELDANNNKTGLEFVMKVMAGDKVDIFGKSYFLNTATVNNANSSALDILNLMTSLLGAPANAVGAKGITAAQLNSINSSLIPPSFIRGNNDETTTIPKAYINYIILDEQFKYVKGGASRVGTSGQVKNHWDVDAILREITIDKNGYIFVYVSNESKLPVFFDNLQVIHKPGPILEETHYYPFGLTMTGISFKALTGNAENKLKYNGYELNQDFDINLYESFYRSHDPQLGRFWQIDVRPSEMLSLYASMANNPISYFDPLGDTILPVAGGGGQVDLPNDIKNFETYQSGINYKTTDGGISVPVAAGELRNFTSAEFGRFSARWNLGKDGNPAFMGYENDQGETYNQVAERHNAQLQIEQGLESLRTWLSKPENQAGLILFPVQLAQMSMNSGNPTAGNPSVVFRSEVSATVKNSVTKNSVAYSTGSFSVFNWAGYPQGGARPTGPFRLLEGAEYLAARRLANKTNAAIHKANPWLKGLQIHEIQPVKFGGSPTNMSNKVFLEPGQHSQYTNFWNALMNNIYKIQP
jgi:RHS repeat-associated protein